MEQKLYKTACNMLDDNEMMYSRLSENTLYQKRYSVY